MTTTTAETRFIRPCTAVWLVLVALTGVTYTVGELHLGGLAAVGFVLLTTLVKGQLVVDWFMGLRRVRLFWRVVLFLWLAAVGASIAGAYLLGLQ
ncbi:MAG: cytochrome C oxidase subunit IV family protein [Gammaproteobacteria bacterium]|nr:cytochrome C oxidase subunit IV family protein [Gammaproteobacteria bacterium]